MVRKRTYIGVIFLMLHAICLAQEFSLEDETREVLVTLEDHGTVKAYIKVENEKLKVENDVFYYWYASGKINKNKGGYSGNLLTGEYLRFNEEKKLICKGYFEEGLKQGEWKYWDEDGYLTKEVNWRNGKKHGKEIIYVDTDSVVTTKYRRGKPLKGFWISWFGQGQKDDQVSEKEEKPEKSLVDTEDQQKERKGWFHLLRKNKEDDEKESVEADEGREEERTGRDRRKTGKEQKRQTE